MSHHVRRQASGQLLDYHRLGVNEHPHLSAALGVGGSYGAQHPRRVGGYSRVNLEALVLGSGLHGLSQRLPPHRFKLLGQHPVNVQPVARVDDQWLG